MMAEQLLTGIPPLAQFMAEGSFLMPEMPAVLRALQGMHAPASVDYDYLMSLSGMGVRLAWQQGWAAYEGMPNQGVFYSETEKDCIETALERAGATVVKKSTANPQALDEICTSIDAGKPVCLRGRTYGAVAVLGYRDDRLLGVGTLLDAQKRLEPHGYNELDAWRDMDAYYLMTDFSPRPMDRQLLLKTLKTAVFMARTARRDACGGAALGVSAFDTLAELLVWDEGFEPLEAGKTFDGALSFPYERPEGYYRTDGARSLDQRFWAGYCDFLCMLSGYANFSRFLKKYANVLPEWKEALEAAADSYQRASEYSGALWKYVSPDAAGVAKFREKDVRYALAAHMLNAKIYTLRAVELLERAIG